MKNTKLKEKKFNIGKLDQKKGEEPTRVPMTRILYISVLVSILTILLIVLTRDSLPPEIPLYYGLPESVERLSSPTGLLIPSITALSITILNAFIILNIKNDLMQRSLVVASLAVTVFSFVTSVKIILLVGSF